MSQQIQASTGGQKQPERTRQSVEGQESTLVYEGTRLIARAVIPLIANLRTEGLENVPAAGGAILAPNHISWADIPLLSFPIKRVTHYMAKIEIFRVPVLGAYVRRLGAFPVRRGEGDREALRTAERVLSEGKLVVIFPEGHRSEGRALIEAHQGVALIAMRAGVPVIPIAISGTERTFRDWNYAFRRPTVTIRYGEPYVLESTGGKRSSADLKRHTDEIMRRIATMLPPSYRGVYAPLVTSEPSPAARSTGAEEAPA